jgi:hypothetical protein
VQKRANNRPAFASNGRGSLVEDERRASEMVIGRAWVFAGGAVAALAFAGDVGAQNAPRSPFVQGFQHIAPVANVHDAINVKHLQKLQLRVPQKCGPRQVAPNVWVKIDCHAYKPVPNAKPLVFSAGRVRMLLQGNLRLDPGSLRAPAAGRVGGAAPPSGAPGSTHVGDSSSFPSVVDHRTNGTEGPIKNQEYTSACTGFALSATMDNAILRLGAKDATSPSHIWAHYGQPDMGDAASGNLNKPIATWTTWPFSPKEGCELSRFDDDCDEHYGVSTNSYARDAKLESELSNAETNGLYKITSIQSMAIPANPNDIAAVLATGADLWVAFSLDVNSWGYQALQQNNNVIPDWTSPEGGHAVMLAGYRVMPDGAKQFLIHNSWGTDWGDHGYAWVSDRMVSQFLKSAYKVKVASMAPPTPQQQQALPLTDDDCDSDELVDGVTGQCSPECPDGSRPMSGVCKAAASAPPAGATGANALPVPPSMPPIAGVCLAGYTLVSGRCVWAVHF